MKWAKVAPVAGDMVRVQTGNIHHYGVYVGEDEVIQFGLAPIARQSLKESEIEVCSSDVKTFLCGGELETAVMEDTDKRRAPEETVALCRTRLGEKGYSIFYNNCEHFAYECVMGEKKSTQMDFVRNFFRQMPIVDVYTAAIPEDLPDTPLYPETRHQEVFQCGHGGVKRQKYYAWRLLEYALDRTFGYKMKEMQFSKNARGKWETPSCFFSISHTDSVVAVAVSRKVIGVDIEGEDEGKIAALQRALTAEEAKEYSSLDEGARSDYLWAKWTAKESVFKTLDEPRFSPNKIETKDYTTLTKKVETAGKILTLSVATENPEKLRCFLDIKLV